MEVLARFDIIGLSTDGAATVPVASAEREDHVELLETSLGAFLLVSQGTKFQALEIGCRRNVRSLLLLWSSKLHWRLARLFIPQDAVDKIPAHKQGVSWDVLAKQLADVLRIRFARFDPLDGREEDF